LNFKTKNDVLVHYGAWILYLLCLQEKAAEGLMSSLQL